jgi:hypothetical protein
VQATYDSTVALAWLRARHGVISSDRARQIEASIEQARQLIDKIDQAVTRVGADGLEETMRTWKPLIDQVNQSGQWGERLSSRSLPASASARPGRGGLEQLSHTLSGKWLTARKWWRSLAGPGLERKE